VVLGGELQEDQAMTCPKPAPLRVWWRPIAGGDPIIFVRVRSRREAKLVCRTLCEYDIFLVASRIWNDESDLDNSGGVEKFDGRDWVDITEELKP